MRRQASRSQQLVLYGGNSFVTFILTILAVAYPVFEGEISSIYGYLGSGLSVGLVYLYRERNRATKDGVPYVITGWLFSAGALFVGILGYARKYISEFL